MSHAAVGHNGRTTDPAGSQDVRGHQRTGPVRGAGGRSVADRRVQRRCRQRLSRLGGHARARAPRPLRHRRQPQLSRASSRARASGIASDFGLAHEVMHTDEMARPEYRANPANRCYHCKTELYTHFAALARERGIRGHRRRQQCRRSWRLSPRAPGGARVRRHQPARRCRPDQGRDPRPVASHRPADLGRAGVGVPVVAHSLLQRGHRREAADDRAGGDRAASLGFRICRVRHHGDTEPTARLEIARDEMARAVEPDVAEI